MESAHDGLIIHDAVREAIRTDLEAIDLQSATVIAGPRGSNSTMKQKSAAGENLWRYSAYLTS